MPLTFLEQARLEEQAKKYPNFYEAILKDLGLIRLDQKETHDCNILMFLQDLYTVSNNDKKIKFDLAYQRRKFEKTFNKVTGSISKSKTQKGKGYSKLETIDEEAETTAVTENKEPSKEELLTELDFLIKLCVAITNSHAITNNFISLKNKNKNLQEQKNYLLGLLFNREDESIYIKVADLIAKNIKQFEEIAKEYDRFAKKLLITDPQVLTKEDALLSIIYRPDISAPPRLENTTHVTRDAALAYAQSFHELMLGLEKETNHTNYIAIIEEILLLQAAFAECIRNSPAIPGVQMTANLFILEHTTILKYLLEQPLAKEIAAELGISDTDLIRRMFLLVLARKTIEQRKEIIMDMEKIQYRGVYPTKFYEELIELCKEFNSAVKKGLENTKYTELSEEYLSNLLESNQKKLDKFYSAKDSDQLNDSGLDRYQDMALLAEQQKLIAAQLKKLQRQSRRKSI